MDISSMLIPAAHAQEATTPPMAGVAGSMMNFLPMFLIFGVFYFLLIKPQQKKVEEQLKMQKAIKRADKVITAGGVYGTVTNANDADDFVMVEIAQNMEIKVARNAINSVETDKKIESKEQKK